MNRIIFNVTNIDVFKVILKSFFTVTNYYLLVMGKWKLLLCGGKSTQYENSLHTFKSIDKSVIQYTE